MLELWMGHAFLAIFMRASLLIGILVLIYIIAKSAETGDSLWVWVPFILLLPWIAIPVYIGYSLKRRREDRMWEEQKRLSEKNKHGYVSRRVTSEKDLTDQYYEGKARKD